MSSTPAPVSRPGPRRWLSVLEAIALAVLWVLFSGKFDALHLGYGVLSIIMVMLLTRHLVGSRRHVENEFVERMSLGRAIVYPAWLLWQILMANLHVAKLILSPNPDIDPVLLHFRFPADGAVAKVTLGNSITLTPGTFTLRIRGDEFIVHSIDRPSASSLYSGAMQDRVLTVFGYPAAGAPAIDERYTFEPDDGSEA